MKILCYGDSNTYGWDPRSYFGGRYEKPWPELLSENPAFRVRADGLCGREIPTRPVALPEDTDLLILMLGTNDLLQGAEPEEASGRMDLFLSTVAVPKVLLIAPPPLRRGEWISDDALVARSCRLAEEYRLLSRKRGIRFLDAAGWEIPLAFDGVHFTEEGHGIFARKLEEELCHA